MKRNNIFMWAYITFIIGSALLRFIIEFSLWAPIVLAITVSSVFFALEDLFTSLYHSSKDYFDIIDSFISETRKKEDREMRVLVKIDKAIALYEDSIQGIVDEDLRELKDLYESLSRGHLETDKDICLLEKDNKKKKDEQNTYEKASVIFSYFGFLCLFFALIIATSFTVPEVIQEIFTVIPFAVILLTRQINGIMSERNGKLLNKCKSVIASQDQKNDTVAKVEEKVDGFVSLIANEEQKEASHAD